MARDDELEDDERPRRRQPRDEDNDGDRPARERRRRDEDDEDRPRKKKSSTGLLIGILVGVFVVCCGGGGVLVYWLVSRTTDVVKQAVERVEETGESEASAENLRKIGVALHNYNDAHGRLPTNTYDDQFKPGSKPTYRPLLSWRVHLLPHLNEDGLYRQFKLNEPWDSPNNLRLVSQMPAVYGTPEVQKTAGNGKTFYRGFSQPGALFEKPRGKGQPAMSLRLPASFPDGTSNTIAVVEAGEAVEWTRPEDLDWSEGRPRPALGGISPNLPYFHALMMDTTVRTVRRNVPDGTLRLLITRNDGLPIPPNWEHR